MKKTALLLATSLSFTTLPSLAADSIELSMTAQEQTVQVDADGHSKTVLVAPTSVIPGDIIVYTTHYKNNGAETATNIAITNEIAKEMRYIAGSADNSYTTLTYSVDGGKHFDAEQDLVVATEDGKERPATANDYTHIRWQISELKPGAKGSVSYKARVRED
jgi:uncharacterized repeat protein (TIGR01451 family)